MAHVPGRFWLCGTGESAILACFVTEVSWEGNTQEVEWQENKIGKATEAKLKQRDKAITTTQAR